MFELKVENNTIPLKWGTWAMHRFCELENKNLHQLIELLMGGVYEISTIVNIVQASAESGCKSLKKPIDFDNYDVCEWIDKVGGLYTKDGQLNAFMLYMQNSMKPDLPQDKNSGEGEKKN